ncbi:hypothetical protein FHR81_005587 [Actinoalloteichus hoggarensis]|uniref:Uncharacterized protein n=1 Tax=Actinoalloteichus hoggarensis TaxID=1470176 RepID=A0A221W7J3_9PSEU|nr:hypothetical protein [Actinoalloteichus hoggarensis]ASO21950.1 hypothetical protein AHOG_21670 [Actinoalloteichus hoggarensis]MBB5924502.1 hypothetical protein [Actinoalloteichus hoggarensis]
MIPTVVVGVFLMAAGFPLTVWGYRTPPARRHVRRRTVAFASILARLAEERLDVVGVRS